jgi:hypothetical protein
VFGGGLRGDDNRVTSARNGLNGSSCPSMVRPYGLGPCNSGRAKVAENPVESEQLKPTKCEGAAGKSEVDIIGASSLGTEWKS